MKCLQTSFSLHCSIIYTVHIIVTCSLYGPCIAILTYLTLILYDWQADMVNKAVKTQQNFLKMAATHQKPAQVQRGEMVWRLCVVTVELTGAVIPVCCIAIVLIIQHPDQSYRGYVEVHSTNLNLFCQLYIRTLDLCFYNSWQKKLLNPYSRNICQCAIYFWHFPLYLWDMLQTKRFVSKSKPLFLHGKQ